MARLDTITSYRERRIIGSVPTREFVDSLNPCLGSNLVEVQLRHAAPPEPDERDWREFVLAFSVGEERFLSWRESRSDWELSSRTSSHLLPDHLPAVDGREHPVVAPAIGCVFRRLRVFEDEFGDVRAAEFHVGEAAFVLAVGFSEWISEKGVSEFREFSGDDLLVWSLGEFRSVLVSHPLIETCDSVSNSN